MKIQTTVGKSTYGINRLPKRDIVASPTRCCPPFDPDAWDRHTFQFDNKLFLKVTTRSFLHIPLDMSAVMKKALWRIHAAGAGKNDEYIMLSREVSPWKAEHLISIDRPIANAETVRLSGTYLAKVFEGPFRETGNWYSQLAGYVRTKGEKLIKSYFYYTTCPRCARAYGKNYVVGFAQVERKQEVNDGI